MLLLPCPRHESFWDLFWSSLPIATASSRFLVISCLMWFVASDNLDGYLARRYAVSTRFGYVFDGFCDRCFYIAALCGLLAQNAVGRGMVALLITRELTVYAGRTLLSTWLNPDRAFVIASKSSHFAIKTLIIGHYLVLVQVLPTIHSSVLGVADILVVLIGYATLIPMFRTIRTSSTENADG